MWSGTARAPHARSRSWQAGPFPAPHEEPNSWRNWCSPSSSTRHLPGDETGSGYGSVGEPVWARAIARKGRAVWSWSPALLQPAGARAHGPRDVVGSWAGALWPVSVLRTHIMSFLRELFIAHNLIKMAIYLFVCLFFLALRGQVFRSLSFILCHVFSPGRRRQQ